MIQRESRSMSPRRNNSSRETRDRKENTPAPAPAPTSSSSSSSKETRQDRQKDKPSSEKVSEKVSDDDLCPICHLLLYKPVTTRCNHTLCSTCMAHWASTSISPQMTFLTLPASPLTPSASMFKGHDTETKCPMCRAPTTATENAVEEQRLRERYPVTCALRGQEEVTGVDDDDDGETMEIVTLCMGNTHFASPASSTTSSTSTNTTPTTHNWTFFLHLSNPSIISNIQLLLPPSAFCPSTLHFKPPHCNFTHTQANTDQHILTIWIDLLPGYTWLSSDAVEIPFATSTRGRESVKGRLGVDWLVDVEGNEGKGRMGRCRVGVVKEGQAQRKQREMEESEVDGSWEVEILGGDDEEEDQEDGEEEQET
jgi:hypothetical protein